MKKQELVHLHELFAEVRRSVESETTPKGAFRAYEELGVRPTAIHRSKDDHHEAIRRLLSGLTQTIEEDEEQLQALPAD